MASTRAAAAVDSAAAAVDSRIRMSRGAYVFVLFLGIYLTGSPLPRCILIVLTLTMEWFLVHLSQLSCTLALMLVFTAGPYSECYDTYLEYARLGPSADEYALLWFDRFTFFLLAIVAMSYFASTFMLGNRTYACMLAIATPPGCVWTLLIPPSWATPPGQLLFLLLCGFSTSVALFVGMDQTYRAFQEKEHAHEKYIAALSHDFGTPISALQMAMSFLPSHVDPDDTAAEPLLKGMSAALEVMSALKRKAIDVGKLQLGEMLTPERTGVDLRELVLHKLPSIVRYMPHTDELKIEYHVGAELHEVLTDGAWILMILLNLVSNALKNTQLGYVSISARLSAGHIRLSVSDTGVGVSEAVKRTLWRAFKQGSRWQSGTGLGLYHVNHLAVALGGTVGYQPNFQAGSGATFWVDVPFVPFTQQNRAALLANPRRSSAGSEQSTGPLGDGTHVSDRMRTLCQSRRGAVLVAEDNLFILDLTAQMLISLGVDSVVRCVNGKEALSAITASDAPEFAFVLMDVQMPFMDGIECTRRVRAWERQDERPPLPILALSANGEDIACIRDCTAAGMDSVLNKPVAAVTLRTLVGHREPHGTYQTARPSHHVSLPLRAKPSPPKTAACASPAATSTTSSMSGMTEDSWRLAGGANGISNDQSGAMGWEMDRRHVGAGSTADEQPPPATFDLEAVLDLVDRDRDLAHQTVRSFHQTRAQRVDELVAAVQSGNARACSELAHRLKGSCGYAGAHALRAAAAQVEVKAKAALEQGNALEEGLETTAVAEYLVAESRRLGDAHVRFLAECDPTAQLT